MLKLLCVRGDEGTWGSVKSPLIKVSYVTVAQQCAQNYKIPHIGV
jgi:hypothetical protein